MSIPAQAELLGGPEEIHGVLMHHAGGNEGYDLWRDTIQNAITLANSIGEQPEEMGLVPVLFGYQIEPGSGHEHNVETALVMVDPSEPIFLSQVDHKRNVQPRGYTGKVAVTTRTLSLVGKATRIESDMLDYSGEIIGEVSFNHSGRIHVPTGRLALSKTIQTDPSNGEEPTSGLSRSEGAVVEINRLEGNHGHYPIGWEAVARTFAGSVSSKTFYGSITRREGWGRVADHVSEMMEFLETAEELDTLREHSGPLDSVFKGVESLREGVASMGRASLATTTT